MEPDLVNVPNIDCRNFDETSFIENNRPSLYRELLQDEHSGTCSSTSIDSTSANERIEMQDIPNGIALTSSPSPNTSSGVAIQSSSGITVGNKNFFSGPVVIKQFFADDEIPKRNEHENSKKDNKRLKLRLWWTQHCWNKVGGRFYVTAIIFFITITLLIVIITAISVSLGQHRGGGATTPSTPFIHSTAQSTETSSHVFSPNSITHGITDTTSIRTVVPMQEIEDHEFNRYVNRTVWGAVSPKEYTNLALPVKRVIISHTVRPQCMNFNDCCLEMRTMQNYEMAANRDPDADIAVNFVVAGDSRVYEGRGYRVGAHTRPYGGNRNSICIGFGGNFNTVLPQQGQLEAAKWFIQEGIRQNKIHPDYKLYGQRQFYATDSPGHILYGIITSWPHWSSELVPID